MHFIRGRVAEVTDWAMTPEEEGKLVIRVEDTLAGFVRRIPVDMVVLARSGWSRRPTPRTCAACSTSSCGTEGFFLERHPKLAPVNTFTDGIFLAGCCQGPKDIPTPWPRPGAAAAEALALIDTGYIEHGAEHGLHPRGGLLRLQVVHPALPLHAPSPSTGGQEEGGDQRGALQGLRHLRGGLPVRLHRAEPVRGRGDLQRNRGGALSRHV